MTKKEISDPGYTKVTHGQTMIGHREVEQEMREGQSIVCSTAQELRR